MSRATELRVVTHHHRAEELFEISGPDTSHVTVLFTGLVPTVKALTVARGIGRALGVAVSVMVVKTARYGPGGGAVPTAIDAETDALQRRLRAAGDVRLRMFTASRASEALSVALAPHSLVVVGGRRRWWPTSVSRMCDWLEAHGHYVLFVDEVLHAA